jgi:hypothetical protein
MTEQFNYFALHLLHDRPERKAPKHKMFRFNQSPNWSVSNKDANPKETIQMGRLQRLASNISMWHMKCKVPILALLVLSRPSENYSADPWQKQGKGRR